MSSYEKMNLVSESGYIKKQQPEEVECKSEEEGTSYPQHELEMAFKFLEQTFSNKMITNVNDVTQTTMALNEMREELYKRKRRIRDKLRW